MSKQTTVEPGQVWAAIDASDPGRPVEKRRHVLVTSIETVEFDDAAPDAEPVIYVHVTVIRDGHGNPVPPTEQFATRIRLNRFLAPDAEYELVENIEGAS